MFDVITIGSATYDVFMKSSALKVIPGEAGSDVKRLACLPSGSKVEIDDIYFATGGGGTNSAVTFAKQGFAVACASVIGNDHAGQAVLDDLQNAGVNVDSVVRHDQGNTAYSLVLVDGSGERTILSYKGEGQHLSIDQIPATSLEARWFYLDSLGGNFEVFKRLIDQAVAHGAKIACNPGGREIAHGLEKLRPLLAHIDIYITNKEEGATLAGTHPDDKIATLAVLREAMPKAIIALTDGKKGSMTSTADGAMYSASIPDAPVMNATGAGDAFGSGFVSEYIRSGDIAKTIQLGTANASSVVGHYGAKIGILAKGDNGPWPLVEIIKV